MGSPYAYPCMPPVGVQEGLELRRRLDEMMEEDRKLREKIERLEKAQSSQSEEDPTFSTSGGDHSKEAETIQEADRPQRGKSVGSTSFQ